jgi:peptide/nickel transport system ATP-binding protein
MGVPLLQVRDLSVHIPTSDGVVKAVDGVSFDVVSGEMLGVVGESGSGKSMTFLTVMGLLGSSRGVVRGQALFDGRDLLQLPVDQLQQVRGAEIAMIFQDPMTSFHPLYKVGDQIVEAIRAHRRVSRAEARVLTISMLRRAGLPIPEQRADQYPHEFSGGMRQRAMIAMAIALEPRVLVADEPTTALDVTVQAQILDLLDDLRQELGIGIVLITHDLGVIGEVADSVMVMYAGRIAERARRDDFFSAPAHPYSWGLLDSLPDRAGSTTRLSPIEGSPPSPIDIPQGCPFHPRCPHRFDPCDTLVPELADRGVGHADACHLPAEEKVLLGRARRNASQERR